MESIDTLKEEGIRVGVSPTISQVNLYEIVDFTKHFIKRGVPVWYCLYWYDYPFEHRMFNIGKKNDEYEIRDRETLVKVLDSLSELREQSEHVYITKKTLEALRQLAVTGERTWECKALNSFLIVDHLGRVAGCHSREPVTNIFNVAEVWNSARFEKLRGQYNQCTNCAYLCYIFYSVHAGLTGTVEVLRDQWKNARIFLREDQEIKAASS